MIRTWIEPIYDRTYGHVELVQHDPYQENPKGCWNANDLNRIEKNTAYCAEWMLEQEIVRTPPEITVYENDYWTGDMIPTQNEIYRILNNVRLLVELSRSNPAIADQLPNIYAATQINYVLANQIEYALELMHNQPELPLQYWQLTITNGVVKSVIRADGTTEMIGRSEALVAEDEVVTILGTEYGEYAQYQTFTYWSGNATDIGMLDNYQSKETTFTMPYRNVSFTANFETHIPRTLTMVNSYISINQDPTAESGPTTGTYYAGDQIMIIANVAPAGKEFYEWIGTQLGLDNIVGITHLEDPSTCLFTMPDSDVELEPHFINVGPHTVTVTNGTGGGSFEYKERVTIIANEPSDSRHVFSNWSGNTSYLTDIYSATQTFEMGDVDINFRANYGYIYSYNSVQMIDGLITVNNEQVAQANGLREDTTYTLVPVPPENGLNFDYWEIEGEGIIVSGNIFRVGDGNAIITGHYAPTMRLRIINKDNENETTSYTTLRGHTWESVTTNEKVGNYRFEGWYEDGVLVSESATLTLPIATLDRTIEARYTYYPTRTLTIKNLNNSHVITTREFVSEDDVDIITSIDQGDYIFEKWIKDGVDDTTDTTIHFKIENDTTIEAFYRLKENYTLTVTNGSGTGTYKELEWVDITANEPRTGYTFTEWTVSGLKDYSSIYSGSARVQMGSENATCNAEYDNISDITIIIDSGTITHTEVRRNTSIAIEANPAPTDWEFVRWEVSEGDATLSNYLSTSTYVYANTEDSIITAIYEAKQRFTVTMENGYVWNGSDWVTTASIAKGSNNPIKMKPAPLGMRFVTWEVYDSEDILQTNPDDIVAPLAESTTLRNLHRDIKIKATYQVPNPEVKYTLVIERKDGSIEQRDYSPNIEVTIRASYPDTGYEFYKWTGDTACITGGKYESNSKIRMPEDNVHLKENFVPEGYIPKYDVEMTNIYGQCCYTTSYIDPETQETVETEHWVSRYSYPEGSEVKIRATGFDAEYYFSAWTAVNHDTQEDVRNLIEDVTSAVTTVTIPEHDIDIEPVIALTSTYPFMINNGATSGNYYAGARVDVYFNKVNTNDIHYLFTRWTGTNIAQLELYDGGMFNVLVPGDVNTPQYVKMPDHSVEITANYKTLYRLTLTNGRINSTSEREGYFEEGSEITITADTPATGMRFQYWTGNTTGLSSIYDPTPTITINGGVATLTAVYSTDAERNDIGYVNTDLKNVTTINNSTINVISGTIESGFIITDVNGHIYIVTNVNNDTSTIYRMTKIVQGGNVYG